MSKLRVALLSAGLSPKSFGLALHRIRSSSKFLYNFDEILTLDSGNIAEYCPKIFEVYRSFLNESVPGYGYWLWKPEFIFKALKGDFGKFDQVVWVDSGCEINPNYFSRLRFKHRIRQAQETGCWFHALENSENEFTKLDVKKLFPELDSKLMEAPQIQANYMHLSSTKSYSLIEAWYEMSISSISNFNFEISKHEHPKFIGHRSDQSTLSLNSKKFGFTPNRINLPSGGSRQSKLRALSEPVWISRNRTGESVIPAWIKRLP